MFKNSLNNTPLFILPNGSPLSKSLFRTHLTTVIKSCSLSPSLYTGQSIRIGAGSIAAERGISSSSINQRQRDTKVNNP